MENKELADMMEMMMSNNDATFTASLEAVKGESDPDLVKKAKDFSSKRQELLDIAHKPEGKFLVIIHNDAWCNNFMFR